MLPPYKEATDVPIYKWKKSKDKKKDQKYKQLRNLVILTSKADLKWQEFEKQLSCSFNKPFKLTSVPIKGKEFELWDAPALKGTPDGAIVQEAINACGGEQALGIAKWGSADAAFRKLLDNVKQVRCLRSTAAAAAVTVADVTPLSLSPLARYCPVTTPGARAGASS
jgi:hypothetical protein